MSLKWSNDCLAPPNWVPSFYRHSSLAYWRNIALPIRMFAGLLPTVLEHLSVLLFIAAELYTLSDKRVFTKTTLSSAETSLCRMEVGEGGKKKAPREWWEEEERKPFPSFHCLPRDCYFFYFCYNFYCGTQREPLRSRRAKTKHTKVLWLVNMLWWIVLFTATLSVEMFILFTYTNTTHKYLNRFYFRCMMDRQISQISQKTILCLKFMRCVQIR